MISIAQKINLKLITEKADDLIIEIMGNKDLFVEFVSPLKESAQHCLMFCNKLNEQNIQTLQKIENCILLLPDFLISCKLSESNLIVKVKNPRLAYCKVITPTRQSKIHEMAKIDPACKVGANFSIGAFSYVGACNIGDNVFIGSNVVIEDGTIIGNNVNIQSGTVIGTSGFGFEKDDNGSYHEFFHLGNVIIGNDVSIGANNCIDKGAMGSTIVEDGVKTDNFVHIAHNCIIGKNTILTAMTELSGSVKVGSGVWFAPTSSVLNGITIGKDAFIGIGAIVTKDVPDNFRVIPAFSEIKPPKK
jgi:UDP-3-O-[3-hydroxymyristoyl] glucosamine N-acyltransferase